MNPLEYQQLRAYQYAKSHAFRPSNVLPTRRNMRSMRTAKGQSGLKGFRVISQIGLETQTRQRQHTNS